MPYRRRRRVYVETAKGRRSAGFTVPQEADAADVSIELRRRGFAPYRLQLDTEHEAWIVQLIDWHQHAA